MRLAAAIMMLMFIAGCAHASSPAGTGPSAVQKVDEVWKIVSENFFDAKFNGADWLAAGDRCRARLIRPSSEADVTHHINDMLDELEVSHTRLYARGEPAYYELLDIYRTALGSDLRRIFRDGIVRYRTAVSHSAVPHEEFLETMRRSARVIERDGQRLAYVRMHSWAGEEYQDLLIELLNAEPLRSCDGLLLDIRGGWGGANPDAIGVFGCDSPALELIARDGQRTVIASAPSPVPAERQWRKPMVLLVDEGTRSGKEVLACAFRNNKRGAIVGARTAGAVLGGKPFLLNDGSLLIVAVTDVLVDGVRLEGVGVEPDVVVERGPIESGGRDAQLNRAAAALVDQVATNGNAPNATSSGDSDLHTPHSNEPAAIFPGVSQMRSTIIFTGRVQGVGFRATTENIAQGFAVAGWVRNERDGSVLCVAEGEDAEVERFLAAVKRAMHAYIHDVQITRSPATGAFSDFGVRH